MDNEEEVFLFGVETSASGASWIPPQKAKTNLKELFIQEFGLTDAVSELLVNRGFNLEDLPNFFDPKIKNLMPDPSILIDMDKTVERIAKAIINHETIGTVSYTHLTLPTIYSV